MRIGTTTGFWQTVLQGLNPAPALNPSAPDARPARPAVAAVLSATALALSGCSAPILEGNSGALGATESPYSHGHGLSVAPATKTILIATHDGLYDVTSTTPVKLSETIDLMGFATTGSVLYAPGHPGKGNRTSTH